MTPSPSKPTPEDRITVDAEVQHGKPVIDGTRVPVHVLVGAVAGGMSLDEVAEEYGVEAEDVKAALEYASQLVAEEEIQGRGEKGDLT